MRKKDGGEAGDGNAGAASGEPAAPAAGWSFNIFAPLGLALENGLETGLDACAPETRLTTHGGFAVP
jgi:hypothetical protein